MAPPLPSAARRLRGADRVVPFLASRSQASHSGNGDPSSIADGSGKWPKIACVWLTNAVANCQFAHRALFFFFIMMAMLAPSTAAIQSTIHSRSTSLPVDSTISVVGPHSIGQSDQFASFGRMHNTMVMRSIFSWKWSNNAVAFWSVISATMCVLLLSEMEARHLTLSMQLPLPLPK